MFPRQKFRSWTARATLCGVAVVLSLASSPLRAGAGTSDETTSAIPQTIEALKGFDLDVVAAGHCTGWRALHALANTYGDRVSQSAVGTTYVFDASVPGSQRATPAPTRFEEKPTW